MPSVSPRLSLLVPNDDTLFVTEDIAANWQAIDERAVGFIQGKTNEQPQAASSNNGFLFYATDTGAISFSNGTDWEPVGGASQEVLFWMYA